MRRPRHICVLCPRVSKVSGMCPLQVSLIRARASSRLAHRQPRAGDRGPVSARRPPRRGRLLIGSGGPQVCPPASRREPQTQLEAAGGKEARHTSVTRCQRRVRASLIARSSSHSIPASFLPPAEPPGRLVLGGQIRASSSISFAGARPGALCWETSRERRAWGIRQLVHLRGEDDISCKKVEGGFESPLCARVPQERGWNCFFSMRRRHPP